MNAALGKGVAGFAMSLLIGCGSSPGSGTQGREPAHDASVVPDSGVADTAKEVDAGEGGPDAAPVLALQLGPDLPPGAAKRIEAHLSSTSSLPVVVAAADDELAWLPASSIRIGLGATTTAGALIDGTELTAMGPEAFQVRTGMIEGKRALAARGNPIAPSQAHSLGTAFGSYRLLEELGFVFAHPLAPTVPAAIGWDAASPSLDERPYWPIRGLQLHTMHPLELTDLLQGWMASSRSRADGSGATGCTTG